MVTTEQVVRLFLDHDDEDQAVSHRTATLRIEQGRLAYLDAMAAQAGVSRNVMANHLLGVGMQDVLASLAGASPETLQEIQSDVADRMADA